MVSKNLVWIDLLSVDANEFNIVYDNTVMTGYFFLTSNSNYLILSDFIVKLRFF